MLLLAHSGRLMHAAAPHFPLLLGPLFMGPQKFYTYTVWVRSFTGNPKGNVSRTNIDGMQHDTRALMLLLRSHL